MHLYKIVLLILISSCGFGYELKINKEFEEKIESDKMEIRFSLAVKKNSAKEVKDIIHPAISTIKKQPLCKGGSYSVVPEYNHRTAKREIIGFYGRANFVCSFESIEEINDVTEFLDQQTEIELQQSPILWRADEVKIEQAKMRTELRAILYASEYIEFLKSESAGQCTEERIEISGGSHAIFNSRAQEFSMIKSAIEIPTKEPVRINISASYVFKCN